MQDQIEATAARLVKVRESLINEKAWIEANILSLSRAINELEQIKDKVPHAEDAVKR